MGIIKCRNCSEFKEHQAKGLCYRCYRKISWKPKKIICKRCKREMPGHAKGLCAGCYNFVFKLNETKAWNYKKYHKIDPETYMEITKACVICGFDKIVELHHLDENKKNNSKENTVGLCPNHHKMFHNFRYREEIILELQKKGYSVKDNIKLKFNPEKISIEKKW